MNSQPWREKQFERYVEMAEPLQLWLNVFGCEPSSTDIANGASSSAALALEAALTKMSRSISSVEVGCPVEYGPFKPSDQMIDLLRLKLLSAAVLSRTAERSLEGCQAIIPPSDYSAGMITLLCETTDAKSLMRHLRLKEQTLSQALTHSDRFNTGTALCFSHGKHAIRLRLATIQSLVATCAKLVDETIADLLCEKRDPEKYDIFSSQECPGIPRFFLTGDPDDRERLNGILKFCGDKIDGDGVAIGEAIRMAPFKRNLIQNMAARIKTDICRYLEHYGLHQSSSNENIFEALYSDIRSLSPLLYRLTGDQELLLEGLGQYAVIDSIEVFLPDMPEDHPAVAIVSPEARTLEAFIRSSGGSDATIALQKNNDLASSYPDLGEIVVMASSSSFSADEAWQEVDQIFYNMRAR